MEDHIDRSSDQLQGPQPELEMHEVIVRMPPNFDR
jgi:hypothetical protein